LFHDAIEDQVEPSHEESERAKILKLADKTSNLRAIAASPPPDWSVKRRREYVEWARKVSEGLVGVSEWLEQEFLQAAKQADRSTWR
jgi:guanosine-3',5'-bis(diphosphate) 3'-pyrophosphohydrolase